MRKLLLSTNNQDKVREFAEILDNLPLEIVTPASLNLDLEVEETGTTFVDNAILKARAFHEATGLLSLSDDSGLEIDFLDGAPGIYSSRYAGLPNGAQKNEYVLKQLEGVPMEERGARYVCEIAIIDETGKLHGCQGILEGRISLAPRGDGGFGFDPIFLVPGYGHTVAEMSSALKNRISHRGKAGRQARRILQQLVSRSR